MPQPTLSALSGSAPSETAPSETAPSKSAPSGTVHTSSAPVDAVHDRIGDRLIHLQHSLARLRSAVTAGAAEDSEWSRHRVLFTIARSEPVRLSALAELVESDPSTLSRQVAALVRAGLIERQADPGDGRASLLVLSATGRQVHQQQLQTRRRHYERMLADWTPVDRDDFARLLERFTDDFDAYRGDFVSAATGRTDRFSSDSKDRGGRP